MSGMHVKSTFTFSAMGTCFPLVCTVTGLTKTEMPTRKKFIHVEVPCLCIGGGGVNINNQEVGHLIFMWNTNGAEKKRFRWYQQEILMPGINDHQKRFAKFDIPDKMTAVTYCDGDFSQINAIKSSIDLFTDNKVIANKQQASWLGAKQPADLAKVFKLLNNMLPFYTVKNIPAEISYEGIDVRCLQRKAGGSQLGTKQETFSRRLHIHFVGHDYKSLHSQ
jgi:hypothetical protein